MQLVFNEERAVQVFSILQKLWVGHEGIFAGIVLPQNRFDLPDDPVKKANTLLFTAITQRGGIISEDPVKYLAAIRQEHPDLFDPQSVVDHWPVGRIEEVLRRFVVERRWKEEEEEADSVEQSTLFNLNPIVKSRFKGKGLYKVDEFATSWRQNAETLVVRWGKNALNMFTGVSEFEEFFARADYKKNEWGIHGMRRKILSLFTIWLQEKNLVPVFPTPIPVDFHALRLLFATGVVTACDLKPFCIRKVHPPHFAGRPFIRVNERLTDTIALWSQPFIVQNGFLHLAINPALWVLSRELCPYELQNKSKGRGRYRGDGTGITLTYAEHLEQNPGLWPFPYNDPAPHCPLAGWCAKVFPSAPFYTFGLLAQDRRVPYPHQHLPGWVKPNGHNGSRKNERA